MTASVGLMRRVSRKPKVTAGLKCAPDTRAYTATITPIARPWAIATPISDEDSRPSEAIVEPAPTKIRVNVPMNSATARRALSLSMAGKLRGRSDGSARGVIHSGNAAPRHLLAQPDAVAFAYVPLLLQVLRVRDASGAFVLTG